MGFCLQSVINKKRASYLYRTATTVYPCFLPDLGEFDRSWSYKTCPIAKLRRFIGPGKNGVALCLATP